MVGTGGCLINVTIHADMAHGTLLLFGLVAATLSVGKVYDIVIDMMPDSCDYC